MAGRERGQFVGSAGGILSACARAALFVLAASSCTTWKPIESHAGWTLYAEPGAVVDTRPYTQAFEPAFRVVEETFGPFEHAVRVQVWSGEKAALDSNDSALHEDAGGAVQDVPGIGPARVRAFHTRGTGPFGPPSGVYVSAPEVGTAVHELVHARLAEEPVDFPLWLEEGIACVLGDGALHDGQWVVDGLACWPLRELGSQTIRDDELARLCALRAEQQSDVRENVLVHFIGWALVFDLYREEGRIDWSGWLARYARGIDLGEARARLQATLDPETALDWMQRLTDPDPGVRLAAAKGTWKLRSSAIMQRLLVALEDEQDPEVQVGLALNVLASAGESPRPDFGMGRMWRRVLPRLGPIIVDELLVAESQQIGGVPKLEQQQTSVVHIAVSAVPALACAANRRCRISACDVRFGSKPAASRARGLSAMRLTSITRSCRRGACASRLKLQHAPRDGVELLR